MAIIKDCKLGITQVSKIYCGTDLVFEKVTDTTAPITTPRPDATTTYTSAQTVYLDVNEPSDTYYTLDGTTPTTASTLYTGDGILLDATTTIKYFSVDTSGNTESVKSTTYTINTAPTTTSYRYVRFIGYGDNTNTATTRLVELQAMHGATNRLLNKLPISGETVNAGGTIDKATDGVITYASGSYPIWWSGAGIPTLTYDLGDWYAIDTLKVAQYSTVNDPRQTRFKLLVSTDNVNYTTIADYSANTTVQPESGFSFAI